MPLAVLYLLLSFAIVTGIEVNVRPTMGAVCLLFYVWRKPHALHLDNDLILFLSLFSVDQRLRSGSGLSYTEFSYQLFQAVDFYHLHKNHNVTLQIGGSDQWGNILTGTDLIKKKTGGSVHGELLWLLKYNTYALGEDGRTSLRASFDF